jgi:hypothetical protein
MEQTQTLYSYYPITGLTTRYLTTTIYQTYHIYQTERGQLKYHQSPMTSDVKSNKPEFTIHQKVLVLVYIINEQYIHDYYDMQEDRIYNTLTDKIK